MSEITYRRVQKNEVGLVAEFYGRIYTKMRYHGPVMSSFDGMLNFINQKDNPFKCKNYLIVAMEGDRIVGGITAQGYYLSSHAVITFIGVEESYRDRYIGMNLVEELIKATGGCTLFTEIPNVDEEEVVHIAQFFRQQGFERLFFDYQRPGTLVPTYLATNASVHLHAKDVVSFLENYFPYYLKAKNCDEILKKNDESLFKNAFYRGYVSFAPLIIKRRGAGANKPSIVPDL